ncbi:MAG: NUDIX domain-containing protein [Deltaproteobacteria bacterium]|nr:NUDIX domain-containing protein [Deltaproteobacteria bacterium]
MGGGAREMVDWVDEQGRVLGTVTRDEMRRRNLLHPVTTTFVFHPDGRLYIHRRSDAKDVYPGYWDMCVGGTVGSGEDYAVNARRELAEELGVRGTALYGLFGHRYQGPWTNNLVRVFAAVYGGEIIWQPEEVSDGRWATEQEVQRMVEDELMCPDSSQGWRIYLERFGRGRNFARDIAPGLETVPEPDRAG